MVIKGGTILDGTGKERYTGDIRVRNNKIQEVGELKISSNEDVIDANGLFVSPGFVDILNHSDAYLTLFENPTQDSLLQQGITTIVMGNCGSSLAPLLDGTFVNSIQKWGDTSKINVNWQTVSEYKEELKRHPFGLNVATLIGHSTLRRALAGDEARALTDEEISKMRFMMEEGLKEGAIGISTGLAYSHARETDKRELSMMMELAVEYDALYSTHIRNESEEFVDSVKEQTQLARDIDVNIEFSHLKISGRQFWGNYNEVMTILEDLENANFDIYPYQTTASVLYAFLPRWASKNGNQSLLPSILNQEKRRRLIQDMKDDPHKYKDMTVAMGSVNPTYFGKTIGEIAHNQGESPEATALNLISASENRVIVFSQSISEDNTEMAIKNPKSFVTSDGVGYRAEDKGGGEVVHPRYFGAFPRFFARYIREKELISWEDAINKITLGPAEKAGLQNRGKIEKGYNADLVVFDPERIKDTATFANPYKYPEGVHSVIVNGEVAVEDKEVKNNAGEILSRKSA